MSDRPGGRRPFRRLQPVERRLQPRPPGDGRRASGRDEAAVRAARPRPGLQLDPAHDASPELPRPAAAAPLVPARRAAADDPAARRGGDAAAGRADLLRLARRGDAVAAGAPSAGGRAPVLRGPARRGRALRLRPRRRGARLGAPRRRRARRVLRRARGAAPGRRRCALPARPGARPERFGFWVFSDNERARRFYESHGAWCLYETDGANNQEGVADARYEWRPSREPAEA